MMSETAEAKQSTRWPKGVSGNPAGRPKRARHKYLLAVEALLDGEAEGLTRKAIELALPGMASIDDWRMNHYLAVKNLAIKLFFYGWWAFGDLVHLMARTGHVLYFGMGQRR